MASIDAGQHSLSSDERPTEFECSPCKDDGLVREATYYCPECSEYFCSSCESSLHRRLKATKSHKLFPASEAASKNMQKSVKLPFMVCVCNRDALVEFICDEHKCLVCSYCRQINHRKCKTNTIEEKSKSFSREAVTSLIQHAKSLEGKANQLCAKHTEHLDAFEASKSKCRENIDQFRNQMVQFIDKLTNMAIAELDEMSVKNQAEELAANLSACKSVIEKLEQDQTLLQDMLSSAELQHMFVADYIFKDKLKNDDRLLEEVRKEIKSVSVEFQADTAIADIQTSVKHLGRVILKGQPSTKSNFPDNLLLLDPVKSILIDVTPKGASRMTGSAFLPNGDLAICNFNAYKLLMLDKEFKEKNELKLPAQPWDVSPYGETELIVTFTLSKQLQFICLVPTLSLGSNISVGKRCYGVEAVGKDIFVLCTNDPGEGEVRILDRDGTIKKRLGMNKDGTYLISQPFYMSINHSQDKVYVSDWSTHTVFCLSLTGTLLYKLQNENVHSVLGVLPDKHNNLLICNGNNLHTVEANGSKYTTFLTEGDGLANTNCVNYRQIDNTLVVTCSQKLLVIKLK